MWGFNSTWGGWVLGLHLLFSWLIPLAIIALLVYLAVTWGKERKAGPAHQESPDPLEILKLRYARGEITSEEYHRMKKELKQD